MKGRISKYDVAIIIVLIAIVVTVIVVSIYTITHKTRNVDNLTTVNDYSTYFMVVNNINSFYEYVSNNDTDAIISLLDNNYITENNITRGNINTHILNYGTDIGVIPEYITTFKIENNVVYFVHGSLKQSIYLESTRVVNNDFNMLMFIDINNLTFSLYPTTEEKYKEILATVPSININKNDYNTYQGISNISDKSMCVVYLTDFLNKISTNIDESYELISSDTKRQLGTITEYKTYINQHLESYTTVVDKCAIAGDNTAGKTFRVYDANGNYFEFIENSIMNYHVNLNINNQDENADSSENINNEDSSNENNQITE